jgi:hypothetical protein
MNPVRERQKRVKHSGFQTRPGGAMRALASYCRPAAGTTPDLPIERRTAYNGAFRWLEPALKNKTGVDEWHSCKAKKS